MLLCSRTGTSPNDIGFRPSDLRLVSKDPWPMGQWVISTLLNVYEIESYVEDFQTKIEGLYGIFFNYRFRTYIKQMFGSTETNPKRKAIYL